MLPTPTTRSPYEATHRRSNAPRGGAVRRVAAMLALVVAAGAVGGCRMNEATGRMQLSTMSRDQEIALGTQAKPELIREYGGEVQSAALRNYVAEIGHRMAALTEGDSPSLPWEFIVLDSDVINAFALPGGKVFVSRGLMREFENEAQLAAVIGHEIGHVTARHIDERISKATGISLGAAIVGGFIGAETNLGALVSVVVGTTGQGYLLKFGRDQESEADALGVRYMVAAGYDPNGMLQLLEVLRAASEGPRQIEMLSTHPYPETRLRRISALIESDFAHVAGNPQFTIGRERFEQIARPHVGVRTFADPHLAASSLGGATCWCGRSHDAPVSTGRFSLRPGIGRPPIGAETTGRSG